jgi:predicted O-methyltransferase YrrM
MTSRFSDGLAKVRRDVALHGLYQATRVNAIVLTRRFAIDRLLRRVAMPTLSSFLVTDCRLHRSSATLLPAIWSNTSGALILEVATEYVKVSADLQDRYRELSANGSGYPTAWAIEPEASLLLYTLARVLRPKIVVETGVANGHSTFVLLRALAANGDGRCISFDIGENVGSILRPEDRRGWQLKVLNRHNARKDFKRMLAELPAIGLFLHDSEHTYSWQAYEYANVFDRLSADGVLVSDDIDSSYAFLDFCREHKLTPDVLLGQTKAVGVVGRNAANLTC